MRLLVFWLEFGKVEALLPPVTLGFGVVQNRENGWLEVEVLRYERDPYFGNMKGSEGIPHFVLEGGS